MGGNNTVLAVLLSKAAHLQTLASREADNEENGAADLSGLDSTLGSGPGGGSYLNLSPDMQNGFRTLDTAIGATFSGLISQLRLMTSMKDLLEGDLASLQLKMDMVMRDFDTLTADHEAITSAYNSSMNDRYSPEKIKNLQNGRVTTTSSSMSDSEKDLINELLREANDKVIELQTDLLMATRKALEADQLAAHVRELQEQLHAAESDKRTAESLGKSYQEEAASYKVTSTLTQKT